jgi:hypothetical protein
MLVLWLLIGLLVEACFALVAFAALGMSRDADDDEVVAGRLAYDRRAPTPARSPAGASKQLL